uniref:Helicase, lymphoid specific n=1 Tax=Paramormyrops kingsleyae TaxID=1676925 RepID=A0A3B3SHY7_9TELE
MNREIGVHAKRIAALLSAPINQRASSNRHAEHASIKDETRSVSPHCPKPNEPEQPQGTAVEGAAGSETPNIKDETEENVVTKEMEEEEKHLMEEGERMEKEMMDKARATWERETHEMRFRRLQHLLEKSNIYSKFLLTKMEQQQQEEKLRKERLERKASAQKQKGNGQKTEKADRRKRDREEEYKIADVMSKEEILSKAKKPKLVKEASSQPKKLEAEDIAKMSDSNEEIKGRLSEAVRDSAKHLLDPTRRVNGQPVPFHQPRLFTGGVMRWYQVEGIEWLRVSVLLYHGPQADRINLVKKIHKTQGPLNMYPVVITSFEIAMRDRKYLQRFQWKYLILDEGHRIKNLNCRLVQDLKTYPTDNKLLLSGTPLQNNLAELWSLLNFLLPDVFDDLKSFESWFDISTISSDAESIVASEQENNILHMLHQILTPFLLRRLKTDVVLDLPPKKEILVYAPLTSKQESLYTAIMNRTISKLLGQEKEAPPVDFTSSGRPKRRSRRVVDYSETDKDTFQGLKKYLDKVQESELQQSSHPVINVQMPQDSQINLKLQNILMLLKKCCNHPYLIEYPLDPTTQEFKIDEQLVETSGKFLILDRMLPELKKRGHKVLIFSQMTSILDILTDYCYLRGYLYSRLDGSMPYTERDENIKKFSSDPHVFLFLLSTRAGGLGINLTAADTVIIFDSDWNPQADLQAQDRCHRIGQTKPIVVYRLVTANTIDWKIIEKASAKRKLEKMVIHKNKFKGGQAELEQSKRCLEMSELVELLKSRDYVREVKGTKGKVISDKDLELLLDRSDLWSQAEKTKNQERDGVFRVIETQESAEVSLA